MNASAAPNLTTEAGIEQMSPSIYFPPAGPRSTSVASRLSGVTATAAIPTDLAMCADCRRELFDPTNRHYCYPFTNCAQCGPRHSIIESLPYERSNTTMRGFTMCLDCAREYTDPKSRRFHAEAIACPLCGPHLSLRRPDGETIAKHDAALRFARSLMYKGLIVAVKGVSCYHLMCDVTNKVAVAALRQRKQPDEKPLAVMFRDLAQLREFAEVSPTAADLLTSPSTPIVLVPRRFDSGTVPTHRAGLAAEIAPGNPCLAALLPHSPLHALLLASLDFPLVATSANLLEEPVCTDNAEARRRLAGIADLFLDDNRPIACRV